MIGVALYRVGRNLNRAYRTCEAFGVEEMRLIRCTGVLTGHLYGASGRVHMREVGDFPACGGLALETWGDTPLRAVDWANVEWIVIGGETSGLPRGIAMPSARIDMQGNVSGLTVEAALAIALYEWRQSGADSN